MPVESTASLTQVPHRQPAGPVSLTINSAKKQLRLGNRDSVYSDPVMGNLFLVLDVTVKNTDLAEGINLTRIIVDDPGHGAFAIPPKRLRDNARNLIGSPLVLPAMLKQNDSITGQVVFELNDSAEYRVNLVGSDRKGIASQPVSFASQLTARSPVDLTIDSVNKVRDYPTSSPMPGHIFLVLNITVKNHDVRNGFLFSWESTDLRDSKGGDYVLHSMNNGPNLVKNLNNPFPPEIMIELNASRTGQIIFAIADSPEYRLNLIDSNRTIIATRIINAG